MATPHLDSRYTWMQAFLYSSINWLTNATLFVKNYISLFPGSSSICLAISGWQRNLFLSQNYDAVRIFQVLENNSICRQKRLHQFSCICPSRLGEFFPLLRLALWTLAPCPFMESSHRRTHAFSFQLNPPYLSLVTTASEKKSYKYNFSLTSKKAEILLSLCGTLHEHARVSESERRVSLFPCQTPRQQWCWSWVQNRGTGLSAAFRYAPYLAPTIVKSKTGNEKKKSKDYFSSFQA